VCRLLRPSSAPDRGRFLRGRSQRSLGRNIHPALRPRRLRERGRPESTRPLGFATVSALALAASLLTKEAALGIPLALLAIGFVQGRPRAFAATAAVQTAAIGVWLFLRALLLHSADGLNGESPMAMILAVPAVLAGYVEALLLPTDLSIERPFTRGGSPGVLHWP